MCILVITAIATFILDAYMYGILAIPAIDRCRNTYIHTDIHTGRHTPYR